MPDKVKEMLKAVAEPAVQLLHDTIHDSDAPLALRIKCLEIALDRNYGKASQPLEIGMAPPVLDLSELTVDELRKLAAYDEETSDIIIGEE